MADYGHDLTFGTFITPTNRQPQEVVALAQLTEAAGLDLVTLQDHPYQPAFLDAWTLLSWVAAQTKTIGVAGNVLNLPLRSPVVLARAAASLDLLSSGRFEMAIGTGGFWDAMESVGGPRRTPRQAVQALRMAWLSRHGSERAVTAVTILSTSPPAASAATAQDHQL